MPRGILWARIEKPELLLANVPPRFEKVEAHHLTLRFGVELTPYQSLVGKRFSARLVAEAWDERIQAVRVELPQEAEPWCENLHPHVTISHAEGVQPKLSSILLEAPPHQQELDLTLEFRVEASNWARKRR